MKLAKDSLWLLAARVGAQGMTALFVILLARRLGSAGFGQYAVMAAVVLIGNMLTTFGTDMVIIREAGAKNDLSMLPSALAIQLGTSLLYIAGTWAAAPLLMDGQADAVTALRVYSVSLIPLAWYTVYTSVLRGRQFADAYAWLNLAGAALKLILAWEFIPPGAGVLLPAILLLFVQVFAAGIGAWLCHVKADGFWLGWNFQWKDIAQLLRISSPLAILTLLAMLQQKLGLLILSVSGGPAMAGIFNAAGRTVEAAETGHAAVFSAMYPEMPRSPDGKRIRQAFAFLMIGALIGAAAISIWAGEIVTILFGGEYAASAPALRILAWMMIPFTVNTYLTLKYVALKMESPVLYASLSSLVVLILASLAWIPSAGVTGACGAALTAELTQSALLIFQRRSAWLSQISPASKA